MRECLERGDLPDLVLCLEQADALQGSLDQAVLDHHPAATSAAAVGRADSAVEIDEPVDGFIVRSTPEKRASQRTITAR